MEQPAHFHGQAFRPQTLLAANRARRGRHVLRQPLAVVIRCGFLETLIEKADHALEKHQFSARGPRAELPSEIRFCVRRGNFSNGVEVKSVRQGGELRGALQK